MNDELLTVWLLLGIAAAITTLMVFIIREHRGGRSARESESTQTPHDEGELTAGSDKVEASVEVASSGIPASLLESCVQRKCVLFAGNALGVQAGYYSWTEALTTMIRGMPALRPEERQALENSLHSGKVNVVAEFLASRSRADVIKEAKRLYSHRYSSEKLSPLVKDLQSMPFVGVVTTHWHSLISDALSHRRPQVLVPGPSASDPSTVMEASAFQLIKIYGSIELDDLVLTPAEYRRALEDSPALNRLLTSLALTRTILFVGASLETVEVFFANLQIRSRPSRPHFALVPAEDGIELQVERFLGKYGVQLVTYDPRQGLGQVAEFIGRLRKKIVHWAERSPKSQVESTTLTGVRLSNIGPFRQLSINLNAEWNVLLGNNGVGKSTLLRAIALGLCGDHESVQPCAQRLLRSGENTGFVELSVGQDIYRTELVRELDRVRAICYQLTPLQTGNWAVLGFPPIRGVSSRNLRGPSIADGSPRPVVADIQPILEGELDRRLDNLKQWIVNMDVVSVPGAGIDQAQADRSRSLLCSVFDVMNAFMPGTEIEFHGVDRQSWNVLVKTKDGVVPIEQISKGMSSLIGWLGTLLQRMYEIHVATELPEREPALVIIDEIDAHLHPEWQQFLVPALKKHFPRLQIVATTHSPLIVAGMKTNEVAIVSRNEDIIEVTPPALDFEGMRADQILTSPLFGLATTRSHGVQADIHRYSELIGRVERSEDDERDIKDLRDRLRPVLAVGETAVERSVEQAVRTALDGLGPSAQIKQADPRVQLEIKRQIAQALGQGS